MSAAQPSSRASRIVIVGPGAMGCGLACVLRQAGADVSLLDHRADRAAQLDSGGIRVQSDGTDQRLRIPVTADPAQLHPADLLIVLVKAYSTESAGTHARGCAGPETLVLTLQNGLGNWETLARHFPPERVLAGTIVMGCSLTAPGEVLISGSGAIVLGSPGGAHRAATNVAAMIEPYWPDLLVTEHIEVALWRKTIVNAAINPLTALTGLTNGALLEDEGLRQTLGAIAEEGDRIANGLGLSPFAGGKPEHAAEQVCRVTSGNRSSMLQDVDARRRTEVDQICGALLRGAEHRGMRVPTIAAVTALVKGLERGYSQPDRAASSHGN